jgi:tetratricopeptide (TPR) repeat protein
MQADAMDRMPPDADPDAVVTSCLADLAANVPADQVLTRLRAAAPDGEASPLLRARYLRARAIATNRLGFAPEALADLLEARKLVEASGAPNELVEIWRNVALVYSWRGEGREAALALLQAVAAAGTEAANLAIVLAEAGRNELEIGRPHEAVALFDRALDLGGATLPAHEHERVCVNIVQALVRAGRVMEAAARLGVLPLEQASRRAKLLLCLEALRIALARSDHAAARDAFGRAAESVSPEPASFSRIELAHAEAELLIAEGNAGKADQLLRGVITRYADSADDLAGREVSARLLHAQALEALGRPDEADRTLAAALRRALARGLIGYADTVRSRIALRGGAQRAWFPELAALGPIEDHNHRFVRRRPIGGGGYGTVERAYDLELGIEVALKRMSLASLYDVGERTRLVESARNEVAAASRIEHPGVVRNYGMLMDANGDALVIEELVEGANLRSLMGRSVEPAEALDLLSRIGFALAAVHAAGVVHRDLKPENVILRDGSSPVLVDFGIAAICERLSRPAPSGTRGYMAPEQSHGRKVDERADLYALGALAHEMLLGRLPEPPGGGSVPRFWLRKKRIAGALRRAGVDGDSADLIAQLLAPWRWRRPRSAANVATRFAKAAAPTSA